MRIAALLAGVLVAACTTSEVQPPSTLRSSNSTSSIAPRAVPAGAEDEPCGPGEEMYVGSGLFAWLPAGTEVGAGSTADLVPHAEAGGSFTMDGSQVEIWRSLQYGPEEALAFSAVGRIDHGVAVFVRTDDDDPGRQSCVLAGLRYDPALDVE